MKLIATAIFLLLMGCVGPRRKESGMVKLPSAEQVEIERLTAENQKLTLELSELTHNCSAVLRVFREAGLKAQDPKAKEK